MIHTTNVLRAAALLALAACTSTSAPKDTTAPVLARSVPAANQLGVDPAAPLALTFAPTTCADCAPCDVDAASLQGHVSLEPAPGALSVRLDALSCVVLVRASEGLQPRTAYTLTVGPGLADVWGNATSQPVQLHFTTGDRTGGDALAPQLLGSFPADGDARLGPTQPVIVLFDEPVRGDAIVDAGGVETVQTALPAADALQIAPRTTWPAGKLWLAIRNVGEAIALSFEVPQSTDVTPPTFAGAAALSVGPSSLFVSWDAAHDAGSSAEQIRYLVYVGTPEHGIDFVSPAIVTEPGATGVELGLGDGKLSVAVRAQDAAGNIDQNGAIQVQP